MAAPNTFEELGLSIVGLGVKYPPHELEASAIDILSEKFYPQSPAMTKVCSINRYTGIDRRSSIGTPDHPVVNQEKPPSIKQLHDVYVSDGIPLAIAAAQKAIKESHIDLREITHVVSTTCTDSANPGFDHFVVKGLGITHTVEKVLLHGVGCSGGLAVLRTAANLALGHAARGKPARILCVALEISTTMVRSELESIHNLQETRIGVALFSDCASAVVLSNGIGARRGSPVYELLGWEHTVIPDTEKDLGFDVDPQGWKVVLTPRVPQLTGAIIGPTFTDLLSSLPSLPLEYQEAPDFDWAMHPGGATVLSGAEKAMGISPEHMRASYSTYITHGNSSSATIFSVLDKLRSPEMDELAPGGRVKEYVVGCAFGPGITVEMCMLKRNLALGGQGVGISGLQTPPETESEGTRSEVDDGEIVDGVAGPSDEAVADLRLGEDDVFIAEALENLELD
ncbi:related to stilbene synthase 2 [Cephalotrichum gorgonifer]|uniref:Related to stilbene synthase 2 n=1 Tax=Cephalotrichum gorgonifer TaxID=2041049 RepID=A0AAE8MU88_9PEZI|nr:related to stilbene synthase 2 [Cephalotrichum gorgonifer]